MGLALDLVRLQEVEVIIMDQVVEQERLQRG
jgi:hypothetical protein